MTRLNKNHLAALWAIFVIIVILPILLRNHYSWKNGLFILSLVLSATFMLFIAVRRDIRLTKFNAVFYSRFGVIATFLVLTGLLTQAFTASLAIAELLFLSAFTFFSLLSVSSDGKIFFRNLTNLTVLLLSTVVSLGTCEYILRIPMIANKVLPPAHVIAKNWGLEDYDSSGFTRWKGHSFRSFHLGVKKPPKYLRVMVLGDSCTWGDKIKSTKNTWPYVLEKTLQENNINNQVVSLAHCGDTTVNELEYLQKYGWDLSPDVVIVQYLFNDPLPSTRGFQRQSVSWMKANIFPATFSSIHEKLNRKSYFYSLLYDKWAAFVRRALHLKDLTLFDLHEDGFPPWENTKLAILEIAEECQKRDVPLLFVLFPIFNRGGDLYKNYPYHSLHKKMHDVLNNHRIEYVDLLLDFARINSNAVSWWALPTDGHPNIVAHAVAGRAIGNALIQSGIAPPKYGGDTKLNQGEHGALADPRGQ